MSTLNKTDADLLSAINSIKESMDSLSTKIEREHASINNKIYPVGSIYISVSDTDPTDIFGGTWEQIKDKFLLSAGDSYEAGSTGGEVNHTLTIDEMPTHYHNANYNWTDGNAVSTPVWAINMSSSTGDGIGGWPSENGAGDVGGSQPHNNMPPYLTVYAWKRTA